MCRETLPPGITPAKKAIKNPRPGFGGETVVGAAVAGPVAAPSIGQLTNPHQPPRYVARTAAGGGGGGVAVAADPAVAPVAAPGALPLGVPLNPNQREAGDGRNRSKACVIS